MHRVVVTGIGTVSSLGNNKEETATALREGRSGIEFIPEYEELGFRSHVAGTVNIDIEDRIDRKLRRFMGNSSAYNYIAMQEAVDDSGLEDDMISNPRTGLIAGSGDQSGARTGDHVVFQSRILDRLLHGDVVVGRTVAHETAQLAVDPLLYVYVDRPGNMAAEAEFLVFGDEFDAGAPFPQGSSGLFLVIAKT